MKNNIFSVVKYLTILMLLVILSMTIVIVPESSHAIRKTFDKVSSIKSSAGIMFKIPIVDDVTFIPKNKMIYDLDPSPAITKDKKTLNTDSYCIWSISDPMVFWQKVGGDVMRSERRIDASTYNITKNRFGEMTQDDILAERGNVTDSYVTDYVREQMAYYGIEIADVKIKQLTPPDENLQAVYNRMISERQQIASQFEAEGKEEAKKVKNEADKQTQVLISNAEADAVKLIAEGEKEYMQILANAYGTSDRIEFYEFVRAMDALKKAAESGQKTLVLPLDSPLAKWFVQK